jgi:molecular chaperone GrpE
LYGLAFEIEFSPKEVVVKEPSSGESTGGREQGPSEGETPREAQGSREERGHRRGGLKGRVHELESALEKTKAEQSHLRAGENLVSDLLPVIDDLEKAVEAARASRELRPMEEGLALILKSMHDALRGRGVQALDPLGEAFDPNFHEAVMEAPGDEAEPGTVLQVIQKGYLMNGRSLRPAKVVVAAAGSADRDAREGDVRTHRAPAGGGGAGDAGDGDEAGDGALDETDDSGREGE